MNIKKKLHTLTINDNQILFRIDLDLHINHLSCTYSDEDIDKIISICDGQQNKKLTQH